MGTEGAKAQSGDIIWKVGVVKMQMKELQGQGLPMEDPAGVFRAGGWELEGAQCHCPGGCIRWIDGPQAGARRPVRRLL